jgi:tetratricopeptide (TPR) repeat protein
MRAFMASAALLAATGVAHAQGHSEADAHARRGVALYNLGKYEDAIVEFEAAYQEFESDALLFNLAQAHRKLEHCERALTYYHQFLAGNPAPALAQQVEKLLPELDAACRTRDARPDGPVSTPAQPPPSAVAAVTADVEPAPPALRLSAAATFGEIISGGSAPITGVHVTALWHAVEVVDVGIAANIGELWRSMDRAMVAQLALAAERHFEMSGSRLTVGAAVGAEYFSLLGSSRDVVPGVGQTNQWAPLVRAEVGIEHDISPLFAAGVAIAASVCPQIGSLEAAVGEVDMLVGLRYAP